MVRPLPLPSLLVVGPLVKELFFAAHLTKEGVSLEELLQHHLMKALDLRLKNGNHNRYCADNPLT